MKVFIMIGLVSLLVGCGQVDRSLAKWTGDASKVCVDGVEYLQFTSGASVAYSTDGSIKLCEVK